MGTVGNSRLAADDRIRAEQARGGDRDAFTALYDRHAPSAWRLGLAVQPDRAAAGAGLAEAFGIVLSSEPQRTSARQVPVRLQLLRATRQETLRSEQSAQVLSTSGSEALQTFAELPEHWRSMLWLTEVEGLSNKGAAAVLGLSERATAHLTDRARSGLHEQFVQAQVRDAGAPACHRTVVRLGGYVSGSLSARDSVRVRRHLDRCESCRGRLEDVDDLAPHLRRSVPQLPVALFAAAEAAWANRVQSVAGPFGLTLPGGRPVPAWAERTLAGATAALITLGITSAILAGARGANSPADRLAVRPASTAPFDPDGGADSTGGSVAEISDAVAIDAPAGPSSGGPAGNTDSGVRGAARAAGSSITVLSGGSARPTGAPSGVSGGSGTGGSGSADDAGSGSGGPDATSPASATPPLVNLRVDDDTAVSVGGGCTGAELLGAVVICEPPPGDSLLGG